MYIDTIGAMCCLQQPNYFPSKICILSKCNFNKICHQTWYVYIAPKQKSDKRFFHSKYGYTYAPKKAYNQFYWFSSSFIDINCLKTYILDCYVLKFLNFKFFFSYSRQNLLSNSSCKSNEDFTTNNINNQIQRNNSNINNYNNLLDSINTNIKCLSNFHRNNSFSNVNQMNQAAANSEIVANPPPDHEHIQMPRVS